MILHIRYATDYYISGIYDGVFHEIHLVDLPFPYKQHINVHDVKYLINNTIYNTKEDILKDKKLRKLYKSNLKIIAICNTEFNIPLYLDVIFQNQILSPWFVLYNHSNCKRLSKINELSKDECLITISDFKLFNHVHIIIKSKQEYKKSHVLQFNYKGYFYTQICCYYNISGIIDDIYDNDMVILNTTNYPIMW